MPLIKVSQLIDPDFHCWKSQIIHQLFEPIATRAILSIPIPSSPKQEKLMWVPKSKGSFMVKLAYVTTNSVLNVLEPTCARTYTCELGKALESKSPREGENVPLETLL